MISQKNLRVSALQEFWSDEYKDSIYLWAGTQHNLTLSEIIQNVNLTYQDLFYTKEAIDEGFKFCKNFYYYILPVLASKLNLIHETDYPVSFWQVVLGYWLHRHISIVYDKYVYLEKFQLDDCGVIVLNDNDFYVPDSHYDYVLCFAGDFGVQQLVSLYCALFSTKKFQSINMKNETTYRSNHTPYIADNEVDVEVALLDVCFSNNTFSDLAELSRGKIGNISLPSIGINETRVDFSKRKILTEIEHHNKFEKFFFESLLHCVPMEFVEKFPTYHKCFSEDIDKRKFTHIVSETWISQIPIAIYVALAKQKGKTFILNEHAYGTFFYKRHFTYSVDYDAADYYLTAGWKKKEPKYICGGLACRDLNEYQFGKSKSTILYISHSKNLYWMEFQEYTVSNRVFVDKLRTTSDFINLLPEQLKQHFLFRPRRSEFLWDTEAVLELKRRNIRIDNQVMEVSIQNSKIVVIDHIGTSLGELLIMGVPFILLIDYEFITFPDEFTPVKQKLISCGILHSTAESAVKHFASIYSVVEIWWKSDVVQLAVNLLKEISLSHSSRTVDYLLSLINSEVNGGLTNEMVERKRNNKSNMNPSDSSNPSYDAKENEIEKAEKLIIENELSLAEKKLIRLDRKYPNEIRILNDIALLKIYNEKLFEAKKIMDNILENNEHYLPAVENQIYLRILIQQKILESNTLPSSETISFAEKLIELNELTLAEKILAKVLTADSSNIDALNDLAVIKILQKDYSAAESFILDVVKVDPKNEMARNNYNYLLLVDNTENNVEEEKIFGQFDFPLNSYEISGRLHLSFWMLKNFPEEPLIRIYFDNKRLWRFERLKKDDVLKYYPHLETFNPYPGVVFWLDTNKMLNGEHELKWFAYNRGKILQFAGTKIYVKNNVNQNMLEKTISDVT